MTKNEVEREVLALVLVAIILISFIGTWAILKIIDKQQQVKYVDRYRDGSQVSLVILPPPPNQQPSFSSERGDDT